MSWRMKRKSKNVAGRQDWLLKVITVLWEILINLFKLTAWNLAETRLANEELRRLRLKEREKEEDEDRKREADAKKKEEILAKREMLQRKKEAKIAAQKKKMIDLVRLYFTPNSEVTNVLIRLSHT